MADGLHGASQLDGDVLLRALVGALGVAIDHEGLRGNRGADQQRRNDADQHQRRGMRALSALSDRLRRRVGRLASLRTGVGAGAGEHGVELGVERRPQAVRRTGEHSRQQRRGHRELQRQTNAGSTKEALRLHGEVQGILLLGFFGTNGAT